MSKIYPAVQGASTDEEDSNEDGGDGEDEEDGDDGDRLPVAAAAGEKGVLVPEDRQRTDGVEDAEEREDGERHREQAGYWIRTRTV